MMPKRNSIHMYISYIHLHFFCCCCLNYEQYTLFTMESVENSSFMYSYRWEIFAGHNSRLFGTRKCGVSAVYESHGPLLSFKSAFASTPCWMLLLSWGAGGEGYQWLWEDIYGLTWLILQSACNFVGGAFRRKGRELLKATHLKHSSS